MDKIRTKLDALIQARGVSYAGISKLLGRNSAYIQQFIKRGSPKNLTERDRHMLAQFFGVHESALRQDDGWAGAEQPDHAPVKTGVSQNHSIIPTRNRKIPSFYYQGRDGQSTMRLVPQLDLGASAGAGALADHEFPMAHIAFDENWLKSMGVAGQAVNMIRVEGDSMSPILSDGDDILVAISENAGRVRDGIYVLRMNDVLMVKRVSYQPNGLITVTSDNPLYPNYPDIKAEDVHIVGRVVWAGRYF